MYTFSRVCIFIFVLSLFGCGSIYEVRTDTNNAAFKTLDEASFLKTECKPGTAAVGEENRSIEEYGDVTIGYVEVDDQGWFYDSDAKQMKAILKRMRSELGNEALSDAQFTTLVFVHGWHHNAHDNDCNVNEFRLMAQHTVDALKTNDRTRKHRLFGIYVGWRGESIDIPGLRYSTIIGRRVTADHVAKGSVRQLFAELAKLQYEERSRNKSDPKGRMRTIVVGHSFGGLIAFNATSQALLNDLVMGEPSLRDPAHPELGCIPQDELDQHWTWPDQVDLINPAFEASRFEPFYSVSQEASGCKYGRRPPKLLIVTADNDSATGVLFQILRWGSTAFERYNTSDQERHDAERFRWALVSAGPLERYRGAVQGIYRQTSKCRTLCQ
ncbi:MAG: esterase/lipase/thioesterase family lipase [Nevskia sp.]|nr:esterase/lipase/thioesterase family lipase [Nevskia sp.]